MSISWSRCIPFGNCVLWALLACLPAMPVRGEEPAISRVFDAEGSLDPRLKPLRLLTDAYHPWKPPETAADWKTTAEALRERILVSAGLWPLPEKTPLNPVVTGRIDRGDYTVEKVYFASRPGHYVSGNLYRPKDFKGRTAGVLCPYGHWAQGRFYDAGEKLAAEQLKTGAEVHLSASRSTLQARMVQLARLGCTVFHYDMVGRADSTVIPHAEGFNDVTAELWLHNKFGLQTWNSVRALDYLLSLPEVDPDRIGVTGASGGGTQTFFLGAIDSRPTAAFPAVMVGTEMQGGCVCENASYLRNTVNNVAFAAAFAPRPLAMSAAKDWTIDLETRGLPEMRSIYQLFRHPELVQARTWANFPHNYSQPSRLMMYEWFNVHLGLKQPSPIVEQDFWPLTTAELAVFDSDHPVPSEAVVTEVLRERMTEQAQAAFANLLPNDAAELVKYRDVIGRAARVMLSESFTETAAAERSTATLGTDRVVKSWCGHKPIAFAAGLPPFTGRDTGGEKIPTITIYPQKFRGRIALWLDGHGKSHLFDAQGQIDRAVRGLLDHGVAVASADLFFTGEQRPPAGTKSFSETGYDVNATFPGYTFCYNRPLLTERVRDVLVVLRTLSAQEGVTRVDLIGTGDAGLPVALAAAQSGDTAASVLADLNNFGFASIHEIQDPRLLPGALRYGGLGGLLALGKAPLSLFGCGETTQKELTPLKTTAKLESRSVTISVDPLPRATIAARILSP